MGIRGYQKFNMIVASESQYSWASTDYSLIALNSDTTLPTGLSTAASTGTSSHTVTDATLTKSFIIPRVFDVFSVIDGTVEGSLKLYALVGSSSHTSDWSEVTKATVAMRAIDSSGSTRTVSAAQEVWSGSLKCEDDGSTDTKQIMYWIDVEDVVIQANERLLIDYTLTYSIYDYLDDDTLGVGMYCTQDTDETAITLPFVM